MKSENLKRIYIPTSFDDEQLVVDASQVINRLINVLRLKIDDSFIAFNHLNEQRFAKLISFSKKVIVCALGENVASRENHCDLVLAFSAIKPDRLRFLIEKCTEIGVRQFIPVTFSRTVISELNCEKLDSYIISACEQSGRVSIPSIAPATSLAAFIKNNSDSSVLFCNEKELAKHLQDFSFIKTKTTIILIGPEGGLTNQERDILLDSSFVQSVSLGHNILRSETAAIVAAGYCASLY